MMRTMPEAMASNKSSIGFLLNSPISSADLLSAPKPYSATYPPSSSSTAEPALHHLLTAASMLGKRDAHSRTSAHSSSSASTTPTSSPAPSSPLRSRPFAAAVTDGRTGSTKRRRRQNIKCDTCGRVFGDSSSMRKHHRVVHLKIKEFPCSECGKTFAEKSNRSKHFIAAHLNQRSHACPDCDKVFNFTDGLRRHRNNVHLGLRPYPCEQCNTSYKQKTHLLKHCQSVHGVATSTKRPSST